MKVNVEPSSVSNVMIVSNKIRERHSYEITEPINKVRLHYKFMKLFHKGGDYMICIGDKVTIDSNVITVQNEQDLKNIVRSLKSADMITL